jgi:2-oxoglutarate ferredoxin oxidoreductase subunit delta
MAKVIIDIELCKGCEYCVKFCPKKILKITDKVNHTGYRFVEVINEEDCIGCSRCALVCPESCIEVYKEVESKK